jgi:cbb3-type cytochrome oxidase subunit 3
MKLSDIMAHAGLSMYAQVALVLFVAAFLLITIRTFAPSRASELAHMATLPLDDDDAPAARRN